jgi:hypothetical protein
MMRCVATVVCLLYVSVCTIFAAVHHHDGSLSDHQQCAACSWHHDGAVDQPVVAPLVVRPEVIVAREEALDYRVSELSPRIHPNRGPPSVLL